MDIDIRIPIPPNALVKGTLLLRAPTPEEHRDFLDGRFRSRAQGVTNTVKAASHRVVFIDKLLIGCENLVVYGRTVTAAEANWKNQVPANIKSAICLRGFEEPEVLTEDDEKNSEGPSGY